MSDKVPQHIAIVMDGNGRWAEERGLLRFEGHRAGVSAVKTVIRCCLEQSIPVLSLFAFSSENWSRPVSEVNFLMELFLESLNKEIAELHQRGIAVRFLGLRDALSPKLLEQMTNAEQLTQQNAKLILNIVVNYGGKWDILQACKKMIIEMQQGRLSLDQINEDLLNFYLSTSHLPAPDLFIRTSGEQRISNFFLWQLAYTELYFTPVYWPDFSGEEFYKALSSFKQRQRRYGKTSQQIGEPEYV